MVIFKETTHSLIPSSKEEALLYLAALPGVSSILKGVLGKNKDLGEIYQDLPESLREKISAGLPLSPTERNTEMAVAGKHGIRFKATGEGINALSELNSYYHDTNPVGKIGNTDY